MSKSLKEHSRTLWVPNNNDLPNDKEIQLGCLQRIADAAELMAKDRDSLIQKLDWARKDRDEYRERYRKAEKRIAALKGVITKMKKKCQQTN